MTETSPREQTSGADDSSGIVYVLTNLYMPGLVKIGRTSRAEVKQRLSELYSTGVPVPFECEYAARVSDSAAVEKAFHAAFDPYRVNSSREFFEIEPGQAIALLRLLADEDVTPDVQEEADEVVNDEDRKDRNKRARRPNLNFGDMGIHSGSELKFINSEETVEVVDNRRVKYKEEVRSLTDVTTELLGVGTARRPTPYWTCNGRLLSEIYKETYGPRDP